MHPEAMKCWPWSIAGYGDRALIFWTLRSLSFSARYLPGNGPLEFAFPDEIIIPQNGYIYIWLSNESKNTRVWFDDLTVTHTQSLLVQAGDYGVWCDVLREQRADEKKYRFGYQGQFAEKDEETGWSHFELREFDAVIGRWLVPDLDRQYYSTYKFCGNNPTLIVDPTGATGIDPIQFGLSMALMNISSIILPHATVVGEPWTMWDELVYKVQNSKIEVNYELKYQLNAGLLQYADLGVVGVSGDILSVKLAEVKVSGSYDPFNETLSHSELTTNIYDDVKNNNIIRTKHGASVEAPLVYRLPGYRYQNQRGSQLECTKCGRTGPQDGSRFWRSVARG